MKKFIPYEKLSKKERREHDLSKRRIWGTMIPVTRHPVSSRAYKRKKRRRSPDKGDAGSSSRPLIREGRQLVLLLHEMRYNSISTKRMVLVENIAHNLSIPDGITPLLDKCLIPLIETISQQRNLSHANRPLILCALPKTLQLAAVLPGDHGENEYAELLNPVF